MVGVVEWGRARRRHSFLSPVIPLMPLSLRNLLLHTRRLRAFLIVIIKLDLIVLYHFSKLTSVGLFTQIWWLSTLLSKDLFDNILDFMHIIGRIVEATIVQSELLWHSNIVNHGCITIVCREEQADPSHFVVWETNPSLLASFLEDRSTDCSTLSRVHPTQVFVDSLPFVANLRFDVLLSELAAVFDFGGGRIIIKSSGTRPCHCVWKERGALGSQRATWAKTRTPGLLIVALLQLVLQDQVYYIWLILAIQWLVATASDCSL